MGLLKNFVRVQLERSLPVQIVEVVPGSQISGVVAPARLLELGRSYKIERLVFAVLSSRADEEPMHLGQGYMITQRPGATAVNRALFEGLPLVSPPLFIGDCAVNEYDQRDQRE